MWILLPGTRGGLCGGVEHVAQGGHCGGGADFVTGAAEAMFPNGRCAMTGHGYVDESHGFFGRAPSGAGDAGDGNREVGASFGPHACSHGAGGFGADSAMGGKDLGRDAQQAALEGIGIGNDSTEIPSGAAGQVRQRRADEATGARLGRGQRAALR